MLLWVENRCSSYKMINTQRKARSWQPADASKAQAIAKKNYAASLKSSDASAQAVARESVRAAAKRLIHDAGAVKSALDKLIQGKDTGAALRCAW
jgi:hypothetical protein